MRSPRIAPRLRVAIVRRWRPRHLDVLRVAALSPMVRRRLRDARHA